MTYKLYVKSYKKKSNIMTYKLLVIHNIDSEPKYFSINVDKPISGSHCEELYTFVLKDWIYNTNAEQPLTVTYKRISYTFTRQEEPDRLAHELTFDELKTVQWMQTPKNYE